MFRFASLVRVVSRVGLAAVALVSVSVSVPLRGGADDRMELLARLVRDDSAKVRVEALRALAKIPTARAAELALGVLEKPMDPTLDYALWLTINDLARPWIEAVRSGEWKPEGREGQLAFALKALKPVQVAEVLGSVLGDRPLPRDGSGPWIEALGVAGGPVELGRLMEQAAGGGFDEPVLGRVLQALGEAARLRQVLPQADPALLERFLVHSEAAVRMDAIRLAGGWKRETVVPRLLRLATGSSSVSASERGLVFEALRQIGGGAVREGLVRLSGTGGEAVVRRSAAVALVALDGTVGLPAVVGAAETLGTEAEALDYWRSVLGVKGAGAMLREALAGRVLGETAARAGIRVAREGGRHDVELVGAFAKAGGLAAEVDRLTGGLIEELAGRALAEGDPDRGERVFRRAELACVTCHAIGGAGGLVGPDMTSIGASAPLDYLVESLLLPSAKIKEGYHAITVETRGGEEVSGTLARETPEELFLRNAAGQEVSIPKSSMVRRETGKLSLMPSGLLEAVPEKDRLDLFAFLGQLGKPGRFDASRGGVARRWRLAHVVHTDQQNNDGDWFLRRPFDDPRWVSVYSLVRGGLSREMIEETVKAQAWSSKIALVAATEVEQAAAGWVTFRSSVPGAELWVGGRSVGVGSGEKTRVELPSGRHRVVLRMDPRRAPEWLELEVEGGSFVLN